MLHIISSVLDWLFPPRPTQSLVSKYKPTHQPCTSLGITYLADYSNPHMNAVIIENKFYKNNQATRTLAELLRLHIDTCARPVVLIPIPLGAKRKRNRGYNQVTQILRAIQSKNTYSIDESILVRTKETAAQTGLNKNERLDNLADAFGCVDPSKLSQYRECEILIIDDVLTTGSTLAAARTVLAPHIHPSATLRCVALAH